MSRPEPDRAGAPPPAGSPPAGSPPAGAPAPSRPPRAVPGWVLPPLMLAAVAGGLLLVLRGPSWIGGLFLAAPVAVGLLWMTASSLWPARAERACPACGEERLERLDPATTQGVRCGACGHTDPEATGWFLAEDEVEDLESLVLAERRRRRRGGGPGGGRGSGR